MSNLSKLVNINISRQTAGVTQAGFGVPLILGPNPDFDNDEIREYSSSTAVAEDFELTDPEYLLAAKIFSQTPRPQKVKIGKSSTPVAQVVRVVITEQDTTEYTITVGGKDYSFTSDGDATPAEIVEGLSRAIMEETVQTITFGAVPDAGAWVINIGSLVTASLAYNDNAAAIQTAIRALAGFNNVIVTGDYSAGFEIVFRGLYEAVEEVTLTHNLTESATPVVESVSVDAVGATPPHYVAASNDSDDLLLTSRYAGLAFLYTENDDNLAASLETANSGIQDDISQAIDVDNDWYFLHTVDETFGTVMSAAALIETLTKIYCFRNNDADVLTNSETDLLSALKALSYFRTAPFYHTNSSLFFDGAVVGRVAPLDPGSETWANKTLAAVSADDFTDAQEANLDNKNANYYVNIAGVNITINGKVSGGEYIDIIRFIDWLTARMQEGIFADIASNDKIPFTDAGIAIVENRMREVLKRGVRAGGIASEQDFTITVPKASAISSTDKANRRLTGVSFTAVLSGAIHAVEINGNVTL